MWEECVEANLVSPMKICLLFNQVLKRFRPDQGSSRPLFIFQFLLLQFLIDNEFSYSLNTWFTHLHLASWVPDIQPPKADSLQTKRRQNLIIEGFYWLHCMNRQSCKVLWDYMNLHSDLSSRPNLEFRTCSVGLWYLVFSMNMGWSLQWDMRTFVYWLFLQIITFSPAFVAIVCPHK